VDNKLLELVSKEAVEVIKNFQLSNLVVTPHIFQKIFYELCEYHSISPTEFNMPLISESLITQYVLDVENILKDTRSSYNELHNITAETYDAIVNKDDKKILSLTKKIEFLQDELLKLEIKLYQDKLTKVFNKQWLIEKKLDDKSKLKNRGVLAIVNLDKFSKINDKYGYDIGNKILIFFSEELLKNSLEVVRFEGDEFLIFFDNENLDSISKVLKTFRTKLNNKSFHLKGEIFHISFSFGVTSVEKDDYFQDKLDFIDDLMRDDKNR